MNYAQKLMVYRSLSRLPASGFELFETDPPEYRRIFSDDHTARYVLEYLIYKRGYPELQIDLAERGSYVPVLRRLYRSHRKSLQLAALRNKNVGPKDGLFGDERILSIEDLLELIKNAQTHSDHFQAYFSNPSIPREVVADIIERKGTFEFIEDDALQTILSVVSVNPLLGEKRDDTHLSGYEEYSFYRLNNALIDLIKAAPKNQRWARILTDVLKSLYIPYLKSDIGLKDLEAWRIEESGPAGPGGSSSLTKEKLSHSFWFRALAAQRILEKCHVKRDKLMAEAPDDEAIRVGFYRGCRPVDLFGWGIRSPGFSYPSLADDDKDLYVENETAQEIIGVVDKYVERDGDEFIEALIRNPHFWQREAERVLLSGLAWQKAEDPHHDMDMPNIYRSMERWLVAKEPTWFEDAEDVDAEPDFTDRQLLESLVDQVKSLRAEIGGSIRDSFNEQRAYINEDVGDALDDRHGTTRGHLLEELRRRQREQQSIAKSLERTHSLVFALTILVGIVAVMLIFF